MPIVLLDETLVVDICYDPVDQTYDDNVCVSFVESCPDDERLFRMEVTHIYLKPQQARLLAEALLKAASESDRKSID
jgi:hypothetical protein